MGYYTRFGISIVKGDEKDIEKIKQAVAELSGYGFEVNGGTIESEEEIKWYEHDKHCLLLSEMFPNHLIQVYGEGDDTGDIWMSVYLRGKNVWDWSLDCTIPPVPDDVKALLD